MAAFAKSWRRGIVWQQTDSGLGGKKMTVPDWPPLSRSRSALLPDTSWPVCGRVHAIPAPSRKSVHASINVNGLQENLKGQEAASEEVRAEFKALVEQCRTALRDSG
jgi:hypothetical protein